MDLGVDFTEGRKLEKNPRNRGETNYNNSTHMSINAELYLANLGDHSSRYNPIRAGLTLELSSESQCAYQIFHPCIPKQTAGGRGVRGGEGPVLCIRVNMHTLDINSFL